MLPALWLGIYLRPNNRERSIYEFFAWLSAKRAASPAVVAVEVIACFCGALSVLFLYPSP